MGKHILRNAVLGERFNGNFFKDVFWGNVSRTCFLYFGGKVHLFSGKHVWGTYFMGTCFSENKLLGYIVLGRVNKFTGNVSLGTFSSSS